jgi:MFS transporter, MFS domain-containing protein family, molybdate-anion transporter
MLDQAQSSFYLLYALLCALLGVSYIRIKSSEGVSITTKDFQVFQSRFIIGYASVILWELIASATFYHTFLLLELSLAQITKLYLATVFSSTLTSILIEIVDLGARKDKCVLSALLYSVSMFSILFGGHYEMLLMGRIVYGVASALQHQAFEAYVVHQHTSQGFPEDWLSQTFTMLTHTMALVAALSGLLGQFATSGGPRACVALCCVGSALSAIYILLSWEKDISSPRFMLTSFLNNLGQSVSAVRANHSLRQLLLLSALFETAICVFSFYWAPWVASVLLAESSAPQTIPFEILFSSLIVASLLGNYMYQLLTARGTSLDAIFGGLLLASSISYGLGSMLNTTAVMLPLAVLVHVCMGAYWPCVGYYRGRVLLPELRSATLLLPK